ncbi:MAG: EAL domain-containing protein [Actinomycetota bacterium]|nr:EAL domain-containing protein [Actinomycetota bacterium]
MTLEAQSAAAAQVRQGFDFAAPEASVLRHYRTATEILGWITLIAGLLVLLLGYRAGLESGRTFFLGAVKMKANVALAFICIGAALVLYVRGWLRPVTLIAASAPIVIGVVTLAEYAANAKSTWFDESLFADSPDVFTSSPGRPALVAATCFVLLGVALVLLILRRAPGLRQGLAVAAILIASVVFLSYILGNTDLATWGGRFSPMALNTAILTMGSASAVIMAEPTQGWGRIIASPMLGGQLFRRFFGPIVILIFVVSITSDYLQHHAFGGASALGIALSQLGYLAMATASIGLLYWASLAQDRTDTQRQANSAELLRSERRYRMLAENATDIVWQLDVDGVLLWISPSIARVLGWDPHELLGRNVRELTHPDDQDAMAAWKAAVLAGVTMPDLESRYLADDRSYRWMSVRGQPLASSEGAPVANLIASMRDIGEEVRARTALADALAHDPLTGLATLQVFQARVERLLAQNAAETPTQTLAVLCVGIDALASVNAALTHAAGDRVIMEVATRLAEVIDDPDKLARGSGDEFLIVLPNLASGADASVTAERLRKAAHRTVTIGGIHIEPTVSIGVASGAADTDADNLLRDAGLALRQAKDLGRDRCAFLNAHLAMEAQLRIVVEEGIRKGLQAREFVPWLQPVVQLEDGATVGFEALVRWIRADGTIVPPDGFLPTAEKSALIIDLDLAVLTQGVELLTHLPAPLFISVNVSARTLNTIDYAQAVMDALGQFRVDPRRLRIEFTETALLTDAPQALESMRTLAEAGIGWYVDDFGTGFSSIAHIRDLPVSGLKLDVSFSVGIGAHDTKSERLAAALSGLATGLQLDTIAEGVETTEVATVLKELGWKYAQGWLYGKAQPAAHYLSQ